MQYTVFKRCSVQCAVCIPYSAVCSVNNMQCNVHDIQCAVCITGSAVCSGCLGFIARCLSQDLHQVNTTEFRINFSTEFAEFGFPRLFFRHFFCQDKLKANTALSYFPHASRGWVVSLMQYILTQSPKVFKVNWVNFYYFKGLQGFDSTGDFLTIWKEI